MKSLSKRKSFHLLVLIFSALLLSGCGVVSGTVWLDENGNGIRDPGELGVEDVTVHLSQEPESALVASTLSGPGGSYRLSRGLLPTEMGSDHRLEFEAPAGFGFTLYGQGSNRGLDSDVDPLTGLTGGFWLNWLSALSLDAGLVPLPLPNVEPEEPTASIAGFTWLDENADGLQDSGEPPMAGVAVRLLDADGETLDEQSTGADGLYEFAEILAGQDYRLAFFPALDYQFTLMDAGDDSIDSDADANSGHSAVFTLGEAGAALDAGFVPAAPSSLGPDEFPAGYNPLTGQPLCVPEAAEWGVVGISISQFPPQATRPPTGLQWVAWVSEWWIGDGDTRLYAQFYGCYPEIDVDDVLGDQQGNGAPEPGEGEFLIGDFVWYDLNGNGQQDEGEPGVPGVGVELILRSQVVASTNTDGAGRYYFLIEPEYGFTYQLRFSIPAELQTFFFVSPNLAGDDVDSDPNPTSGLTDGFTLPQDASEKLDLDAGMRHSIRIEGVRSGRLVYEVIRGFFEGCTVIAGADPTVLAQMKVCAQAGSNDPGDIGGAGIDVTRLQEIAANNVGIYGPPNLTGNLFEDAPPQGCSPANSLTMFYNVANQTYWSYDAGSASYIRHQNTYLAPDVQEPSTEALTGEPLRFENVMVFFVEHEQLNSAGTIFDVHMESTMGRVKLLRDGLVCDLHWSTINGEYEQETGRPRPIRFVYADGSPFPLKPGKLFMHMVHINADFFEPEAGSGDWRARWYAP